MIQKFLTNKWFLIAIGILFFCLGAFLSYTFYDLFTSVIDNQREAEKIFNAWDKIFQQKVIEINKELENIDKKLTELEILIEKDNENAERDMQLHEADRQNYQQDKATIEEENKKLTEEIEEYNRVKALQEVLRRLRSEP